MALLNKGLVSGSVGFASRAAIQMLLFLVMIVATRFLSIAEFGSYALASAFILLSRALFYVGPYEYLLKSKYEPHLEASCFGANLILATAASIGLAGLYFVGPLLFETQDVSKLIVWLIPSIFAAATTAWYESILLRSLRVQRYYVYTVAGEVTGATVAIAMLVSGYGVMSLVAQVYARLFSLIILYAITTGVRPKVTTQINEIRLVIMWSWSRYAGVFLNFISGYGADFVLGIMLSPAATGIYRASNRIVSALTDLFAQPLQKIAQTNLSLRVARGEAVGTSWLAMLAGVGALGWAAIVALAFLARDLVPLILGEKWAPAAPVVMVFCLVKAFSLVDAVTTALLVCHDRQRTMLWVQISVAGLVVGLSWLTAGLGPVAVAAAAGSVLVGMSLIYGGMALRISGVSRTIFGRAAVTALLPALGVAAAFALLNLAHPHSLRQVWQIALAVGVIAAGFLLGAYPVRRRILASISQLAHPPGSRPIA